MTHGIIVAPTNKQFVSKEVSGQLTQSSSQQHKNEVLLLLIWEVDKEMMRESVQLLTYKVSDDAVIRSTAFTHLFVIDRTVSLSCHTVTSKCACLFMWHY